MASRFHVTWEAGGRDLVLNGTATRKKFIVKVYVAGLYLPARETDAEKILAADEPRHIVLQFVHDVTKARCATPGTKPWRTTPRTRPPELKGQFATLCSYMEDIKKGEQFVFSYLPGEGTRVDVKA
jgi:hypothetical protein